jgi:hypothetical protein
MGNGEWGMGNGEAGVQIAAGGDLMRSYDDGT